MTFKLKLNKVNRIIFYGLGAWLIIRFFIVGSSVIYPIVGSGLILIAILERVINGKKNKWY